MGEREPSHITIRADEAQRIREIRAPQPNELPEEVKEILKSTGYGCLALEADIGIVHVCHAQDNDIAGFAGKPVSFRWQLIEMPTAPLIQLDLIIWDHPENPFRFESFLNIAEVEQANILAQLANQDRLYMAFYGDALTYRYTIAIPHDCQQWQQLDEISAEAIRYQKTIPPEQRDFNLAKMIYMHYF